MPELRKDPVVGRWVIISTERSRRPTNFPPPTVEKTADFCPFCPGNEDKTPPEVLAFRPGGGSPNTPGWSVRVVPNKFPALQIEGTLDRRGEGLYDRMNGVGAHEVVIEGPEHSQDLADLPAEHIEQVLAAYRERVLDLHRDRRFRYVLIFKNHGAQAGATLEHTHTQLIATPIIPKILMEEIEGSRKYCELKERCVFCDIVQQETAREQRPARGLDLGSLRRDRAVRAALPVRDLDPAAPPRRLVPRRLRSVRASPTSRASSRTRCSASIGRSTGRRSTS